ncbi:sterol desaturase family protein [Hoeflea prorocentri]|uniref:Sterol desaturase family protein n=1 Tax=Hoeflea prorocentri TaxID=1922333 RepID=A0A9X3ULF0_9HYPH|nr:sterol desaturase family protein [Hoeflea prorocentri]MCY6383005.1 sterol desaturase family protein [Hoeflea prorocentri]MDA5400805.1 sterol desaturase family protein [Hoeflea prorocentri]
MDDLEYGARDERGNWTPKQPAATAPLFVFPPRPVQLLKWLPSYFLPYNVIFFVSAILWWVWVVPPLEDMRSLSWNWTGRLFIINVLAVLAWYFVFELRLYIQRAQGTRFKYNSRFPSDTPSKRFWFESQNTENVLRTLLSGVPIWTLLQILVLYGFANGWGRLIDPGQNWLIFACLCLIVPVIHEFHFYCIHRLIHTRFLYKWVHSVHHKSVNPSPWSSLAMHPVEHLLYFATIFYHLILPSHPLIAIYQLHVAGFGAIPGHVGFHRVELGENRSMDPHAYIHYLHHRFFEVNYGDGLIPLDKWFGTFHDGSKEAHSRMKERLRNNI